MAAPAGRLDPVEDDYVLVPPGDRQGYSPTGFMLHRRTCLEIASTRGALLLEAHPRWLGTRPQLIEWATSESGEAPAVCPACGS